MYSKSHVAWPSIQSQLNDEPLSFRVLTSKQVLPKRSRNVDVIDVDVANIQTSFNPTIRHGQAVYALCALWHVEFVCSIVT